VISEIAIEKFISTNQIKSNYLTLLMLDLERKVNAEVFNKKVT